MKPGSQNDRILKALECGPKTNSYFVDVLRIFKYSSRLDELRKMGYDIIATHIEDGLWEYELVNEA